MVSEPWASSGAVPREGQRGIASVFRAAVWSLNTGQGQHWVLPTGLLCVSVPVLGKFLLLF